MLSVDIIDRKRKKVGKVDVREDLLQGPINRLLASDVIRALLANLREGNAATKTRGDVNFTNKKIFRQKGTGNARHGSKKAPIFVGGGTVFGPHPRDYSVQVPRRMRTLALLSALRLKWKAGKILVVSDLAVDAPKTKVAARYFKDLEVRSAAVLVAKKALALEKSIRNMPHFGVFESAGVSLLDLCKLDYIVCTPEALKAMEARVFRAEGTDNREVAA